MALLSFLIAGAYLSVSAASVETSDGDDVLVLAEGNFSDVVNSSTRPMLIQFYDPSCGYCKNLAPHYAETARILKKAQPPIRVAKVDGIAEQGLRQLYKVTGFPFIVLVIEGRGREYRGAHTSQALVTWTMKAVGPLVTELETAAEAEQFDRYDMTVIGLFQDGEEDAPLEALKKVAPRVDDVLFAYSTSPAVIARCEGEGLSVPAVRMAFPHDERTRTFSGDPQNHSDILKFVQTYRYPAVSAFNGETAAAIFADGRPLFILFRKSDAEGLELEKAFREVAPRLDRQLIAIVAGSSDPTDQKLMQVLDVGSEELPVVRIENTMSKGRKFKKYRLRGSFSVADLEQFISDYHAGKLTPFIRSAPAPASQSGPVHTLVGSTFDAVVKDPAKDVLVYFHVPWCEPCKKIGKAYNKVADRLEHVKTLVVAQMDASVNDFEGDDLEGYPHFRLWRASNKDETLAYEGEREAAPIIDWLLEKSSIPISMENVKPKAGKGAAKAEL